MFAKKIMKHLARYLKDYDVAIITGASSGIGKAFANILYRLNPNIQILNISRNALNLEGANMPINGGVDLLNCDLYILAKDIENHLSNSSKKILLINNAGFADYNYFAETDVKKIESITKLNNTCPVVLTRLLLDEILERKGSIINLCSTAAFQPTPLLAIYGASKSFMLSWTLALNAELANKNVNVLALCPGPTPTNFFSNSGIDPSNLPDKMGKSVDTVAYTGLKALMKKKPYKIVGLMNRFLSTMSSLVPLNCAAKLAYKVMQKYKKSS